MPAFSVPFFAGRPQFPTPALQAQARSAGAATAWQAAAAPGHEWLRAIQGDFAIALPQADGSVLMAVDRFGVQSLCWTVHDGQLHVAPRATDLPQASRTLDPQALFDYVYFHVIPSPRTVFRGVHRLPAGHCAVFKNGKVKVQPYWSPSFAPGRDDFPRLRDEFRALLRSAVERQYDAGSVPACYLSGGTDSSTVAGLLGEVAGQPVQAYSIGFEAEGYDEMAYARIAAKRFGVRHHEYYVTPADLLQGIPLVAAHYDQPFGNSSAVPAYFCALRAREGGVTRLLAGDGGDELFGGNVRYATQRLFSYYERVPGWLHALGDPLLLNPLAASLPVLRRGGGYIRQARMPLPDRLQTYNLLNRLGPAEVFTPALLSQVDPQSPIQQQREVWAWPSQANTLDRNLAFDWRYTLAENDLPKVVGTASLAGVGVGFPLIDDELLAFSMRLPASYKLRGRQLRWFFKEALRGFLPDEIITKSKHGFGLPFGVWMRRHEGLRALADDALRGLSTRGFVQPAFVKSLLDQRVAEHAGYFGEMVWILMMLEHWLRQHAPDYRLQA